jgi:hypothetical protein
MNDPHPGNGEQNSAYRVASRIFARAVALRGFWFLVLRYAVSIVLRSTNNQKPTT